MEAKRISRALSQLPPGTDVESVEVYDGTVTIHYSGVSAQDVEMGGWDHVDSTDWYGVAEYDESPRRAGTGGGFGGMF